MHNSRSKNLCSATPFRSSDPRPRVYFNILAECSRNYKSALPFDGFYVRIHHRGTERTEISRKNFVFFVSLWLILLLNGKAM